MRTDASKLPDRVRKALADAHIRINVEFDIEVTELKSTMTKANIFSSYAYSDYKTDIFYYKITVPNVQGLLLIEDAKGSVRIVRNTLTLPDY